MSTTLKPIDRFTNDREINQLIDRINQKIKILNNNQEDTDDEISTITGNQVDLDNVVKCEVSGDFDLVYADDGEIIEIDQ